MADQNIVVKERSGLGAFIAGAVIVAAIIGGVLYANGYFTPTNEITIELPKVNVN